MEWRMSLSHLFDIQEGICDSTVIDITFIYSTRIYSVCIR